MNEACKTAQRQNPHGWTMGRLNSTLPLAWPGALSLFEGRPDQPEHLQRELPSATDRPDPRPSPVAPPAGPLSAGEEHTLRCSRQPPVPPPSPKQGSKKLRQAAGDRPRHGLGLLAKRPAPRKAEATEMLGLPRFETQNTPPLPAFRPSLMILITGLHQVASTRRRAPKSRPPLGTLLWETRV